MRGIFTCVFRVGMKGGRDTEGGREGGREEGHEARKQEGKEGNRVSHWTFGWGGWELGGPLKPRPPDLTPAK